MIIKICFVFVFLLLAGCSSNSTNGRSLFDRLEFGPDECGNFEASGTIDPSSNPFVNANVHVNLNKEKPCLRVEAQ